MSCIFKATSADTELYETQLRDFLPESFIDIHSHLAPAHTVATPCKERLERYWMLRIPFAQTAEEYARAYEDLFPGKRVTSVAFAMPILESDLPAQNEYVLRSARENPRIIPFYVARPHETEAELEDAVSRGFVGLKPYPDLVESDHPGEEAIEEFFTPAMCEVAERHALPVVLHIARAQRFADPRNIDELLRISERWPSVRLIIAHLGRSFNPMYLEKGLELLNGACPWHYDFSAVTNPEVLAMALAAIPRTRLCFGLDNPVMLSRGYYEFPSPDRYAVHINGYNLDDPAQPPLAYRILLGFKEAAQELSLSREEVQQIFLQNACDVLRLPTEQFNP